MKNISEIVKSILRTLKSVIFVVNKSIRYLLFRFYSTEELMVKADETMIAARKERSEQGQQFMIPCPRVNSWGKGQALDKERIICEFVKFSPIMNQCRDEECMTNFLNKVIANGVQDPGLTPYGEFLPRSAPLIDFLWIGLHYGAGRKYPSANTIHGIQAN